MDELKLEARQLVYEWEGMAGRYYQKNTPEGEMASDMLSVCADQLKTIIEAHESKLPNLNIDIGEELPDLLKKQAE